MMTRKASIALGCVVAGALVIGVATQSAQAQYYSYYPSYTYVAPAPVVIAPAPVYYPPPVYCAPRVYAYRPYGYAACGPRPYYPARHYGHHGRGFSFGFSYRH